MDPPDPSPFKRARCDSFASLEETHRLLEYDLDLDDGVGSSSNYFHQHHDAASSSVATPHASSYMPPPPPPPPRTPGGGGGEALNGADLLLPPPHPLNHPPLVRRPPRIPSLLPRRNISALDYLIKAKFQADLTTPLAQQEWKKLTRTEKHVFETLAKEDLERYQRELVLLAKRALAASTEALSGTLYAASAAASAEQPAAAAAAAATALLDDDDDDDHEVPL